MAATLAVSAVPAMAKDNDRHENRVDNRLDRLDERLDKRLDRLDDEAFIVGDDYLNLVGDVGPVPFLATDGELADELCSPLNSDAINDAVPGCIFDNDADLVGVGLVDDIDFDRDLKDFDIDFEVDRDIGVADGNGRHNGKGKGDGKGRNDGNPPRR
jgi:hypothetical protein